MENFDNIIDVPFENRHQCWFCGEPSCSYYTFQYKSSLHSGERLTALLPACNECCKFTKCSSSLDVFITAKYVKGQLVRKYRKDLAIGINWTEQELKDSQFEGGNFAGFQRSAWFMYCVAKQRVNFQGWPVVIEDIQVELPEQQDFLFDGVQYPDLAAAVVHYSKTFFINRDFLTQVIMLLGEESFAEAVRFCRLQIASTEKERQNALVELLD